MYHRVASEAIDPWGLCVCEDRFAEHLAILKQDFHPVSLQELLAGARRRRIRHGSVAISFDDGYADNVGTALPMLLSAGVPVTFFIATAAIDSMEPFWWDQLAWTLFTPRSLPETLEIRLPGHRRRWELERGAQAVQSGDVVDRPWDAPPASRAGLHYSVWGFLRELSDADRRVALAQLRDWSGSQRPDGRGMSLGELRRAADTPGVDIGAHSVSHPNLVGIDSQARVNEIAGSKRELERRIGRGVTAFAYPFGDYDEATMLAVREAGFELACAGDPGAVSSRTDPYAIPRLAVGQWNGAELRRRLTTLLQ